MPPSVQKMGQLLADALSLVPTPLGYRQAKENCVEIAETLIEVFGYRLPVYRGSCDLLSLLFSWKARVNTKRGPDLPVIESKCFLVCRQDLFEATCLVVIGSQQTTRACMHVTIEHEGIEYNFGANDAEGFPVTLKIPLERDI